MAAQKARLMREIQLLKKSPPPGVQCWVCDDANVNMLHADVAGPPESPYAQGVFRVELDCTGRYPFEPPKARFLTPIYHPNIDTAGRICLDLLKMPPKGSWKPSINISTLLTSLQLLMSEPNPEDGLLPDVSSEFKYRRGEFLRKARAHTEKHAVKGTATPGPPQQQQQKQQQQEQGGAEKEGSGAKQTADDMKASSGKPKAGPPASSCAPAGAATSRKPESVLRDRSTNVVAPTPGRGAKRRVAVGARGSSALVDDEQPPTKKTPATGPQAQE